jgi:hypothetical protein
MRYASRSRLTYDLGEFDFDGGRFSDRYHHSLGLSSDPARRAALAALWQEAVDSLPPSSAHPPNAAGAARPDIGRVFARVATLAKKPSRVVIRVVCRRSRRSLPRHSAKLTSAFGKVG